MFGMFPFMYNNNNYNNNYNGNGLSTNDSFFSLINSDFINGVVDQLLSSDMINDVFNDIFQEEQYDVSINDYGSYYLIKGYLPGVGPRDVNIDFEKNKAILTIHRGKKQNYSNGSNINVTIIQGAMDVVKTFYIEEIDVTRLSATFDNDLLLLTLPKLNKQRFKVEENDEPTIIDVENYKFVINISLKVKLDISLLGTSFSIVYKGCCFAFSLSPFVNSFNRFKGKLAIVSLMTFTQA